MILDERVRASLAAETRFADVRTTDVTGSTNHDAADLAAAGAPEGLVVCADSQTAGRGRMERRWDAQPGDALLVSVLLRPIGLPVDRWHLLTAAAALAAKDACRRAAGVEVEIKWPNDLLHGGKKLAGILAEASAGAVVVGMGLNVHSGPPGSEWVDRAAGRRTSRVQLLELWLRSLDRRLGDWDSVAEDYRNACATVGRAVSVEMSGGEILIGIAERVDEMGRLVVRPGDGPVRTVSVGDVSHLRPAGRP